MNSIMENQKYFDRIYVCSQDYGKINCKKFDSYFHLINDILECKKNDNSKLKKCEYTKYVHSYEYDKNMNQIMPMFKNHVAIIPICKYSPLIFDKFILTRKLKNLVYANITTK